MMRYREPRFPCARTVSIRMGVQGAGFDAFLVNVSARGARVSRAADLQPGTRVSLIATPLDPVKASVRWARGGEIGLEFERALPARALALLRKSVGHNQRPVHTHRSSGALRCL